MVEGSQMALSWKLVARGTNYMIIVLKFLFPTTKFQTQERGWRLSQSLMINCLIYYAYVMKPPFKNPWSTEFRELSGWWTVEVLGGYKAWRSHTKSVFSHVRLFATPWIIAQQAPLSMGILQARILEWVSMPSSRESSQHGDWIQVSHSAGRFLSTEPPGRHLKQYPPLRPYVCMEVLRCKRQTLLKVFICQR